MSAREVNTYVPAHQIRNNNGYLWVRWWRGEYSYHAHFHRTTGNEYQLAKLTRTDGEESEERPASFEQFPDGLVDALRLRYDLIEDTTGGPR